MISGRLLCGVALFAVVPGFHRQSSGVLPLPISGRHDSVRTSRRTMGAQASDRVTDSVVRALTIGTARFFLDSNTTFQAVQQQLGQATIAVIPHEYEGFCYQAVAPSDTTYIVFLTNEFGGPDRDVLGFRLSRQRPESVWGRQCKRIRSPGASQIRTDNGLSLGMPWAALKAIMGTPASVAGQTYTFEYDQVVKDDPKYPGMYDIMGTLEVEVREGVVIGLSAWYCSYS